MKKKTIKGKKTKSDGMPTGSQQMNNGLMDQFQIEKTEALENPEKKRKTQGKKKLVLKKSIRIALIITFCTVALLAIGFLLAKIFLPDYQLIDEVVAQAEGEARIEYEVHLTDNPIYKEKALDEDNYYLKPFTGYVDMNCTVDLKSDDPVQIETVNGVDVILISQLGSNDEAEVIWQKEYIYAKQETDYSDTGEISLARQVRLDFASFDALVTQLIDEYDLMTDYLIKVKFNVLATLIYDGVEKETPMDVELVIPFTDSIFTIDGETTNKQTILIEEKINEELGVDFNSLILGFVVLLTSLVILLLFVLKTTHSGNEDMFEIEISKIFKEYGDRLAGLSETLDYQASVMISINKIQDMVKIADEIGQTVFYYQVEEENERKIEFYVFDEGRIYYMVMFGQL